MLPSLDAVQSKKVSEGAFNQTNLYAGHKKKDYIQHTLEPTQSNGLFPKTTPFKQVSRNEDVFKNKLCSTNQRKTDRKNKHVPWSSPISRLHDSTPFVSESLTPVNPKTLCELCNKDFFNESFLKIHTLNEHGNYNVSFNETLKLCIRNGVHDYAGISNNTYNAFGSMPKMPDLVPISSQYENQHKDIHPQYKWNTMENHPQYKTYKDMCKEICEICNKKLCNKYFLVAHKQKKHGIFTPNSKSKKVSRTKI